MKAQAKFEVAVSTIPPVGVPAIMDNEGVFWIISSGMLHVVGDDSENGGYPCESIEQAADVLRTYKYI